MENFMILNPSEYFSKLDKEDAARDGFSFKTLEESIQTKYRLFMRAEKSSYKFEAVLKAKEWLVDFSDHCENLLFFHDEILGIVTRLMKFDRSLGFFVSRQTDNCHWNMVEIYLEEEIAELLETKVFDEESNYTLTLKAYFSRVLGLDAT
jgi:hypothetical protein